MRTGSCTTGTALRGTPPATTAAGSPTAALLGDEGGVGAIALPGAVPDGNGMSALGGNGCGVVRCMSAIVTGLSVPTDAPSSASRGISRGDDAGSVARSASSTDNAPTRKDAADAATHRTMIGRHQKNPLN